jgi:hypothetical protein
MVKCPECGAEVPGPGHVGLRIAADNIISRPIGLKPGKKYARQFYIAYLPERVKEGEEALPPCVVIASEEKSLSGGHVFVAGAKFYDDEIDKLQAAWEDVMLAYLAFKSHTTNREPASLLMAELRSLYNSQMRRADLGQRLEDMADRIKTARDLEG